jgi:carboxylesterase type B
VNENIAALGGNPAKVTIWGESAGASSVGFQLVAYNGRDDHIISGGIMESGNSVPYSGLQGSDHYQPIYNTIVNATGCYGAIDTLQCLRNAPFNTLNAAINTSRISSAWYPVVDGDFIQKYPSIQLANGEFLHVPIIDGANSDEGISFGPRGINTSAQFESAITGK